MIALTALPRDRAGRARHLRVDPAQEPFCGSIDSHLSADEPSCDWHVVEEDGSVLGFFKIDRDYVAHMPLARPGELGLRGVMIDRAHQGRGAGRAAMAALPAYLRRAYPVAPACLLTVNTTNPRARAVYLAAGFRDTGLCHPGRIGPQNVLRLDL